MPFGLSFRDFGKKKITGMRTNTPKSSFDPDLILVFFIINILFYPHDQSAFYPRSAVCSLRFTLIELKTEMDKKKDKDPNLPRSSLVMYYKSLH